MVKNNIKLLLQKANRKFSVDLRRKDSNQLIQFISNFSFPRYEKRQLRFCALFGLKVLTNEKRGGLKVIAFDKPPFRLFTLKFSNKSIQPSSCERPKTAQRILFLLFANNNCFPVTLQCRKNIKKSGKLTSHVVNSNRIQTLLLVLCRHSKRRMDCQRYLK